METRPSLFSSMWVDELFQINLSGPGQTAQVYTWSSRDSFRGEGEHQTLHISVACAFGKSQRMHHSTVHPTITFVIQHFQKLDHLKHTTLCSLSYTYTNSCALSYLLPPFTLRFWACPTAQCITRRQAHQSTFLHPIKL